MALLDAVADAADIAVAVADDAGGADDAHCHDTAAAADLACIFGHGLSSWLD